MKRILFLLAFSMLCYSGFSQASFNHTTGNVKDSIHNTGIDTLKYTMVHTYPLASIQVVITKTSGTAAGTSILSCSMDGVNYNNTDTLTLTNVTTNSVTWNKQNASRYWRIITGGATTVDATVKAKILGGN